MVQLFLKKVLKWKNKILSEYSRQDKTRQDKTRQEERRGEWCKRMIAYHMGREHFLLIPLVDMSCDLLLWWYDQLPGFDINLCLTETLGQLPAYLDSLLREVNLRLRMFHHTCCLYYASLSFRNPTLPYVSSWPLRWYDMDIGYQIYVWWNGWSIDLFDPSHHPSREADSN